MRRRLYFLLPDIQSAQKTMNDLLLMRIGERHLHFMARDGTDLSMLHEANLLQTTDLVHSAELGLVIGGGIGIAAGLAAAFFPPVGDAPQWGLALMMFVIGCGFGSWVASMIGSSAPNSRLRQFKAALEAGYILLMVDVPRWRVEEIEARVESVHAEVVPRGIEPTIPAFP